MSAINVTNVAVLNNPASFSAPFQFEVQYECLYGLKDDLEWRIVYVGCAEDEKCDQVLDTVLVGPVAVGAYRFVFQADPPDVTKIPERDLVGVTVVLLTCSYHEKEFIRVGYYVNNEYGDEALRENPPEHPVYDQLVRNILADKPRVTRFPIEFDGPAEASPNTVLEPESGMEMGGAAADGHDASLGGGMESGQEDADFAVEQDPELQEV